MSRERELLRKCADVFETYGRHYRLRQEVEYFLSHPDAESSKTVYGGLATAYRPSQHEASMAAVERHKAGETPETNAIAGEYLVVHEMHGPIGSERWVKYDDVCEILSECGRLERQRNELRAENEELRKQLNKGE